jgi:hypothetical protein
MSRKKWDLRHVYKSVGQSKRQKEDSCLEIISNFRAFEEKYLEEAEGKFVQKRSELWRI